MASVISASTTSTTAFNVSADTSGVLQLATGATPTTAVTVDASQNVGIGTTSPAQRLQVDSTGATSTVFSRNGGTNANTNVQFKNSTTSFYLGTNTSGNFSIKYNDPDLATSPNMVIDSSGNVGIGTTSPNISSATTKALTITSASGQDDAMIEMTQGSTIYGRLYSNGNGLGITGVGGIGMRFYTASTFAGATERMRIDSSGNLLVGASSNPSLSWTSANKLFVDQSTADFVCHIRNSSTTSTNNYGLGISYAATPNNTGQAFIDIRDSTAQRAAIRSNGGLANFSANNVNLSDERLKTDILPATTYLDKICSIPVVTFKYKDQTDEELNLGVIAQEVDKVAPELVDHSGFGEAPEGESPYLAIYQTDLQYALMKCIQEQQTIINDLKARIETLESK